MYKEDSLLGDIGWGAHEMLPQYYRKVDPEPSEFPLNVFYELWDHLVRE